MSLHRMLTVTTGAVVALATVGLTAQSAVASPSQGKVRVHLLAEGHAQKGIKVCATAKAAPTKGAVKGTCHKTNAAGYVTLTRVPHGQWFVTTFDASTPAQSSAHKVKVHAGKTTKYTFNEQVG